MCADNHRSRKPIRTWPRSYNEHFRCRQAAPHVVSLGTTSHRVPLHPYAIPRSLLLVASGATFGAFQSRPSLEVRLSTTFRSPWSSLSRCGRFFLSRISRNGLPSVDVSCLLRPFL